MRFRNKPLIEWMPKLPIDISEADIEFLEESLDGGRLDKLHVARVKEDTLYVLGQRHDFSAVDQVDLTYRRTSGQVPRETSFRDPNDSFGQMLAAYLTFGIYRLMPGVRQRARQAKEFHGRVAQLQKANLRDIAHTVEGVKIYQGSIDEVEKDLKRPVVRIDTHEPTTFLKAKDSFWLRVDAYLRGANAIVHYQPGSSLGTPVAYADKE